MAGRIVNQFNEEDVLDNVQVVESKSFILKPLVLTKGIHGSLLCCTQIHVSNQGMHVFHL